MNKISKKICQKYKKIKKFTFNYSLLYNNNIIKIQLLNICLIILIKY